MDQDISPKLDQNSLAKSGPRAKSGALAAYASLEFPFTILTAPILAVLPPLYAKEYGIELASLSVILLALRIMDAITDPLTGYLSDKTRTRFGPRKPWILTGSILSLWAAYNLFNPPETADRFYIGVWLCAIYIGWTLLEVPYRAWSAELTTSYEDRSRLSLYVRFSGNAALLAFGFLPLLFSPTNEFDFAVLRSTSIFLLILLPIGTMLALFAAPVGDAPKESGKLNPIELWRCLRDNRALTIWLVVLTIGYLGIGTAGALFFVLFDTYLGIGHHFTLISTTSQLVALASLPLWAWLIGRYEKRTIMVIGLAGIACTLPILHFIQPGPLALPLYMLNDALWYTFLMGFEVAVLAMVGDIADSELDRSGEGRSGLFCAAWAFSRKAMYGVGAAIAYGITGWAGYDPSAETNSDFAVLSLKTVNGGLPALICACAAIIALAYPLTRARHRAVRQRLEAAEPVGAPAE
ncbi:MAG: MFS transporter [Pseudomonadota bacterium]